MRDVAVGLWLWRQSHPEWREGSDWEPEVASFAVESRGAAVWATPWHERRVLSALRALLALEFEHVLVSHGEPVHDRAEFEAALEREPWPAWSGA